MFIELHVLFTVKNTANKLVANGICTLHSHLNDSIVSQECPSRLERTGQQKQKAKTICNTMEAIMCLRHDI